VYVGLSRGRLQRRCEPVGDRLELQGGEVAAQLLVDGVGAHQTASANSAYCSRETAGARSWPCRAASLCQGPLPGRAVLLFAAGRLGCEGREHGVFEARCMRGGANPLSGPGRCHAMGGDQLAGAGGDPQDRLAHRHRDDHLAPSVGGGDAVVVGVEGDQRRARDHPLDFDLRREGERRQRA
jgi:hypothetical protein